MLYNYTETYDCAFYLAAFLFLLAGIVISLPVLKFHKPNKTSSNYKEVYDRSTSSIETQTSNYKEVYARSTSSIKTQTLVEDLVQD